MGSKGFVGFGLVLLIILAGAVFLSNPLQTYEPTIAEPIPINTATVTVPPPPTFIVPSLSATFTPTILMTTAVSTPIPNTATPEIATTTPTPTLTHTPEPSQTAIVITPSAQPVPDESITFAVIGDYGYTGQGTFDVAALVHAWQPNLILTVGDNNYPDGAAETITDNITQHYGAYINQNRFYPTLGNHDYHTDLAQPYFDYFNLPGNERYYDFVQGNVHFFAINSDWHEPDGITSNSRQAQWLQAQLADSESPWQIVYFHAPPFVSNADKIVPVMNWSFAAWGADIVFSGHAHLYERLTVDGIPYIVNGLGGHSIYNFDETPHPASEIQYNGDFGAILVEVNASELTLQFINRAGSVIDFYTLLRP